VKRLFQAVDIKNPTIKEVVRIVIQYRLKHPVIEKKDTVLDSVDHVKTNNYSNIMQKIDRIDVKLPEVPTLVFELNEIIANPMSSASDIARIINKSPSLTATLLKIVNSAFYGLRSKIDSISRAVMLMGSKEVSNLAMGITIMETFKDIPKEVMDVSSFLEHNLACGIVARILAAHSKMSNTEQLFVSGMLHDIGRLIFCKYFPEYSVLAFTMAEQSTIPLYKAEQKIFGCTHTQIGKKLLNKWKLPILLVDNVYYHHQPSSAPNPAMAATLQMADIIVHGLGIGSSAEQMIPAFDEKAWQRTNLPIGAFPSLIKQAEHQLKTFREFLTKGNS
ncbi:MAG: HDOD domain-containing protein, partial [Desulfobacteraceae bacterium]